MSSSSDGYGGLSPVVIINLGIWVPILVMFSAYFLCSTKYKCFKNTNTGKWCCSICKRNPNDTVDSGLDHSIIMNIIQSRSDDQEFNREVFSISTDLGFETMEDLQLWYNNYEESRSVQASLATNNNQSPINKYGRAAPPPSYASLFSSNDDGLPSYDDLPKLV